METIMSQKGKVMLLVFSYRYRKDGEIKDESTSWRCCNKNGCHGRLKIHNDNILSTSEHNHAPEPTKNEASKVMSAIRRWAVEGDKKLRQVIQQARNGIPLEVAPHLLEYTAL